ncbi:methyltransferase domain-containing protein [Streptomyces sp. NPDC020965]|uniref:methyltransferase domain-containing protein n=1 Tax=Streptomyces sp. NPDC020965 TaxID=3365105 RepID=UPI00379D7E41
MDWEQPAERLARQVTDPDSRWRGPVAGVPRHELVPRWWERDEHGRWTLRVGTDAPAAWLAAAYADRSLITRVGTLHADHAQPDDHPEGSPTSSATLPSLVVSMLRHGRLGDGLELLDLGTGAGGLTAYAAYRLGPQNVTSLDVDPYLTSAAAERLARLGLHSRFLAADATREIPGTYDRIIATVGMPAGPGLRPLLGALREGGRLVTTLARTTMILTGWKQADGDVVGKIERDWAGFMLTRSDDDYPPPLAKLFALARDTDGEEVSTGRYPVVDVAEAWEVRSMLEVTTPGVELDYRVANGQRMACLVHPDGSWARASAEWTEPPTVHQSGPRRLWDTVERIRTWMLAEGGLPLYGARVRVAPDGVVHLARGQWEDTMGAS